MVFPAKSIIPWGAQAFGKDAQIFVQIIFLAQTPLLKPSEIIRQYYLVFVAEVLL